MSLRILRVYPFLPPMKGGMEKHVVRLTQEQRKLGASVILAFNQGDPSSQADIHVLPGIPLRNLRPQLLRDLIFYTALIFKLRSYRGKIDMLHVHGDWSAFSLARIVAIFLGAHRLVASIHGRTRRYGMYRLALKHYDSLFVTGCREALKLSKLEGVSVHWQSSGIEDVFLQPRERAPRPIDVIFVGSFVKVKNIPLIIEIAVSMPNISFELIGDGPDWEKIVADSARRGISNICFSGHLKPEALADKLRSAKIFLLTSFSEGTSTAMLEAMASGLAIVTSASNDYDPLIEKGVNGYVVNGFAATNYCNRIRGLIDNRELLETMSRRNIEKSHCFSWREVATRINSLAGEGDGD